MTSLFNRLQPAQKLRISPKAIAQLLKIPKNLIVRVECWQYVIFVHRRDRGGQFLSYRQLQQWLNATACQIQNCTTWQQLRQLWQAIEADYNKYNKQYQEQSYQFLSKIWTKCWQTLWSEPESAAGFG
ncbi:MAG: hypothetical protein F6K58_05665 [Symploca sp. SIO2E9]|nr:hypothetical protein [Symploca sp. SIO2E9]